MRKISRPRAARVVESDSTGGDFWWAEWRMTYPDGKTWICVDLMELRDGRVYREVVYWAVPFEAPSWRAQWVESDASHPRAG